LITAAPTIFRLSRSRWAETSRLVVVRLKGKVPAIDIVALARSSAKASDLGITVSEADYLMPETLASALAGMDRLLLISSSEIGGRSPSTATSSKLRRRPM
jgi:uncharacterized protein YbjT (DUF2867 family)